MVYTYTLYKLRGTVDGRNPKQPPGMPKTLENDGILTMTAGF